MHNNGSSAALGERVAHQREREVRADVRDALLLRAHRSLAELRFQESMAALAKCAIGIHRKSFFPSLVMAWNLWLMKWAQAEDNVVRKGQVTHDNNGVGHYMPGVGRQ
ncbi:hypothetical protein NDU88_002607 [Pleurodeles waltl]|uniref:Uncharacterized protein n=1 Tax=Pleurodeles waltl TaxID=8319 RepID=A0AAV7UBK1_PLEWA|nr:hypothetical protein NDU88_002607 [Pleurodeles waltl]